MNLINAWVEYHKAFTGTCQHLFLVESRLHFVAFSLAFVKAEDTDMNSQEIVRIIETELSKKGISKGQFYKDCGITSASFSQWRTGLYFPSRAALKKIEEYLGISFSLNSNTTTSKSDTAEEKQHISSDVHDRKDIIFSLFEGTDVKMTDEVLADIYKLVDYITYKYGEDKNKNDEGGGSV